MIPPTQTYEPKNGDLKTHHVTVGQLESRKTLRSRLERMVDPGSGCLCSQIRPLIALSQVIGIFLPTRARAGLKGHLSSCSCTFELRHLSFPNLANWLILIVSICLTSTIPQRLAEHMTLFFEGTDLYAFALQVILLYAQGTVILLMTRLKSPTLVSAWAGILTVHTRLKRIGEMTSWSPRTGNSGRIPRTLFRIRIWAYVFTLTTVLATAWYAYYFISIIVMPCFAGNPNLVTLRNDSSATTCWLSFEFIFEKCWHPLLTLYHQTTAGLFSALCLIIYTLNLGIGDRMKELFAGGSNARLHRSIWSISTTMADEIEELRMLHETLCRVTRKMGAYFGLQLLIISTSSVVSIICGIYTLILGNGNFPNFGKDSTSSYLRIWTFHLGLSAFVQGVLLVSGQLVTNSAYSPLYVLNSVSHSNLDAETKYQITLFMNKMTGMRSQITAWNVTKIGMPFLASAAANVTTYVLVILQFRLATNK